MTLQCDSLICSQTDEDGCPAEGNGGFGQEITPQITLRNER